MLSAYGGTAVKKLILWTLILGTTLVITACSNLSTQGSDYTMPQIDLSIKPDHIDSRFDSLYEITIVDNGQSLETNYLGHPDSVLLGDNHILTLYPQGHGLGAIAGKVSTDGGKTWSREYPEFPTSWSESKETPTIYRLGNIDDKSDPFGNWIIMTSANPSWGGSKGNIYGHNRFKGDGFNAAISKDNGASWSEFEKWFGYKEDHYVNPIVAMASLTRLKNKDGSWSDRWMGFFHDYDFVNYKTILSFDTNGDMIWSTPEPYFSNYRSIEKYTQMCEVEVVRSNQGNGDILALISRSNNKKNNSLISISEDEGKSWSKPFEAPAALSGERHKADWLPDGRLFISFRSIERDEEKVALLSNENNWFSEGWVGWVGTFDDLISGSEGEYRVKLAHTFLDDQIEPESWAHADTGYAGNVVLKDGTVVTTSYGRFGETYTDTKGNSQFRTYIVSKRLNMKLLDELVELLQ